MLGEERDEERGRAPGHSAHLRDLVSHDPGRVNEVNELCKLASDTIPIDEKGKLILPNYVRLKSWIFDLSNNLDELVKAERDVDRVVMKQ